MEVYDVGVKNVPNMVALRIPDAIKPDLSNLILLEKRKLSNIFMLLVKEAIPIKKKTHDHKSILCPIPLVTGDLVNISRLATTGDEKDYKESPGLNIEHTDQDGNIKSSFIISKGDALTLAANLSIFLNEINL